MSLGKKILRIDINESVFDYFLTEINNVEKYIQNTNKKDIILIMSSGKKNISLIYKDFLKNNSLLIYQSTKEKDWKNNWIKQEFMFNKNIDSTCYSLILKKKESSINSLLKITKNLKYIFSENDKVSYNDIYRLILVECNYSVQEILKECFLGNIHNVFKLYYKLKNNLTEYSHLLYILENELNILNKIIIKYIRKKNYKIIKKFNIDRYIKLNLIYLELSIKENKINEFWYFILNIFLYILQKHNSFFVK